VRQFGDNVGAITKPTSREVNTAEGLKMQVDALEEEEKKEEGSSKNGAKHSSASKREKKSAAEKLSKKEEEEIEKAIQASLALEKEEKRRQTMAEKGFGNVFEDFSTYNGKTIGKDEGPLVTSSLPEPSKDTRR